MLPKSQIKFLFYFVLIFLVIFIFLYSLGLVPETIKPEQTESFRTLWDQAQKQAIEAQLNQNSQIKVMGEEPTRIVISKIGVDTVIANPNTTDVATLDDYLLRGAVRYPGSGLLGVGNMFLFGHSSSLTVVNNPAYRAFSGLRNLAEGDLITVYSATRAYTYRVTSVVLVDKSKALVEFGTSKNMLTLSSCNTFGRKDDRYVVQADLVD